MSLWIALCLNLALICFVHWWYNGRKYIRKLHKQSMPMPPLHWFNGHLSFIKKLLKQNPSDASFNYATMRMARDFKDGMFYLDAWPYLNRPALIIANPWAADRVMRMGSGDKPYNVCEVFEQLTGGSSLITMPEAEWKKWRCMFAPAFSQNYVLDQVSKIVERGQIFCDKLESYADEKRLFQLEEPAIKITIDVITLLCLGSCSEYQRRSSPFAEILRELIESATYGRELNPWKRWNPLRPFSVRRNGRVIDSVLRQKIEEHIIGTRHELYRPHGAKSILSLALYDYLNKDTSNGTKENLEEFMKITIAQIRLFLVAGHDTTASTLTYTFHLLQKHPAFLQRVRAEHDSVFGKDPTAAADLLRKTPCLVNQLPFTLAAIKETLRLFPPAGGIRMGSPNLTLTSSDGTKYPTANCLVFIVHEALHRNPAYWRSPNSFLPERWLVGPEDPLYPVKGAYRPFETGPHNCIGQNLAILEIKTVLVLSLRKFDIKPAYEEWDTLYPKEGIRTVGDERVYQVAGGGGGQHPSDRYPCRVSVRAQSDG